MDSDALTVDEKSPPAVAQGEPLPKRLFHVAWLGPPGEPA